MAEQPKAGSDYTVQPGDTLWSIAQRAYNDSEDWDTIYQANKQVIGNNPNLIKPGQVLKIPQYSDQPPQPVPTTHPPVTTTKPPITTPAPTTQPPAPTTPAPKQQKEDDDSPLDWIEKELGEKKED